MDWATVKVIIGRLNTIIVFFFFRQWNYREHAWYYHDLPSTTTQGYTGSVVVAVLIILLWLYSVYKLWLVWINKLNFDGVSYTFKHSTYS